MIRTEIILTCDECGDQPRGWYRVATTDQLNRIDQTKYPAATAEQARAEARLIGWKRGPHPDRDLCADCKRSDRR